jgi:hypothetical protein
MGMLDSIFINYTDRKYRDQGELWGKVAKAFT